MNIHPLSIQCCRFGGMFDEDENFLDLLLIEVIIALSITANDHKVVENNTL